MGRKEYNEKMNDLINSALMLKKFEGNSQEFKNKKMTLERINAEIIQLKLLLK